MTRSTTSILFLLITLYACQEVRKDDNSIQKANSNCDAFMKDFKDGKFSQAIQSLKQISVIDSPSIDSLDLTVNRQMRILLSSYGKILSYEFIRERKVKDFIIKRFYILRFEKYYLKFDFVLYRIGAEWKITNFNYNEDLIEVLY